MINYKKYARQQTLFLIIVAVVAIGNGLSDSVLSNYFKEVYNVNALQRAFIEFPRELPGFLCVFFISLFSLIGDIRIAFIAQVLSCVGLIILGLFTPSFGVMLIFLFIYSMGMHLYMPLQDSIGMKLAEPDKIGIRMGQYASIKTAGGFISGIAVFIGFKSGFFSFQTDRKTIFLIGGFFFLLAAVVLYLMKDADQPQRSKESGKLLFRYEYRYYYFLTVLQGVQKQIAFIFGSWVIIELLSKGADVMAVLFLCGNFLGIFFLNLVGRWINKYGIKFMMFMDAYSFIFVYIIYGVAVWAIFKGVIPSSGWPVFLIYVLFVLDRLSMQIGVVKSVYLKSIAVKPEDVTKTLSTGISLDHMVSILASQLCGVIWVTFGPQWVFFTAALFSLGNLYVAYKLKK